MENNQILEELHKGCDMGLEAIKMIIKKVDNDSLREVLEELEDEYNHYSQEMKTLYKKYSQEELPEVNVMEKMMAWYGLMKDTLLDSSDSKIADIMIQGTSMGINEGRKILNHKKMDKKVHNLCEKFINMQEKYVEKFKKYL